MNTLHQAVYKTSADESILLLDEALIERQDDIKRVVLPGKKIPFVMEPDKGKPWEVCGPGLGNQVYLYGTVLFDDLVGKR